MSNSEYREAQQQAREHGLKARHEQRLENATYTAAEVKVLTEAALRLGRKEAGEEIAEALEGLDPKASTLACAFLARTLTSPTYSGEEAPRAVLMFSEDIDQATAQAISDASSARTDLSVDTDLPRDSQAVREPQEDA